MRLSLLFLGLVLAVASPLPAQENEIVANLAGGRVIIHVAKDSIIFAAIDHPLETKAVQPRLANIDRSHVGILFGASEWQISSQPKPIRLDLDIERPGRADPRYLAPGGEEADLEQIGVFFLERLRPLVSQLHHKIELKPDEPLFEIVLIGFAPKDYGPEVWVIDYRAEQEPVSATSDYWQTHILRPRFTQLYPPEKGQSKTLVELRFPDDLQVTPLLGLIQQNDPRTARLGSSDQRFAKVLDWIEKGQAQKANPVDATDFMRAVLPLIAGDARFFLGNMGADSTFQWIVPPEEPFDKEKQAEDKNRPPEAPTLRKKPTP